MNSGHGFYNTINAQGDELKQHEATAATQAEMILRIFKGHPDQDFTPCEIHNYFLDAPLLTSVRRSITNLTRGGHLERTKTRRLGAHGAMNYTWQLKQKPATQGSLGLDDFKEEGLF